MQSLKQDRTARPEVCEEVWCVKCKGQGHDKDHCPIFANYLAGGGLMPLSLEVKAGPSVAPSLWCAIFQITGKHAMDNCHLLQKYTQNLQQLFCNFCRLVGNDERTCRSNELMMDRTPTYRVQAETWPLYQNAGMARIGFQRREWGRGGRGPGRGRRQLICYNCGGLGNYARDCMNPTQLSCLYCTLFDHETEDFLMLIARIRDKGALPPPPT